VLQHHLATGLLQRPGSGIQCLMLPHDCEGWQTTLKRQPDQVLLTCRSPHGRDLHTTGTRCHA
jgi:hypothetical protein